MDKLKVLFKSKKNIAIMVLSFLLLSIILSYPTNNTNENTIDSTKNQIEELTSSNNNLKEQIEQDNAKINELQNTITSLEKEKKQLEDDKTNLQNQNNELNTKVEELQKTSSTPNTTSTASTSSNSSSSNSSTQKPSTSSSTTSSSSDSSSSSQKSTTSSTATSSTYVLNTNTKKFHKPNCSSVSQIKDSNKQSSNSSRDTLISQGYEPCKKCNP